MSGGKARNFGAIVLLFTATAVGYGVLHDMVTAHVSVEYFTEGHPHIIESKEPWAMALLWGVLATWHLGVATGILVAFLATLGPRPSTSWRRLVRPALVVSLVMAVLAMGSLFAALSQGRTAYEAVAHAHVESYTAGGLGAIVLVIWTGVHRFRVVRPRLPDGASWKDMVRVHALRGLWGVLAFVWLYGYLLFQVFFVSFDGPHTPRTMVEFSHVVASIATGLGLAWLVTGFVLRRRKERRTEGGPSP